MVNYSGNWISKQIRRLPHFCFSFTVFASRLWSLLTGMPSPRTILTNSGLGVRGQKSYLMIESRATLRILPSSVVIWKGYAVSAFRSDTLTV